MEALPLSDSADSNMINLEAWLYPGQHQPEG
ncbi:hypothetical protein DFP94_10917 [Fontibacillus phaseoli]|uniref:Uncharacterized protein n=1 Tax=Fontibacillus phaseoli TaxID=1416533 RepID=A0A369BCA4_9BACL|nr:hypothetical protein DFP94_10917 [Fontibacillus phaseoli]